MTIYFSNPGHLDIRLLSTFGVNVKPQSTSPIGHFGTGLKYAIAGVLRLGGTVQLHQGEEEYNFFTKEVDYRGKVVPMVHMAIGDAPAAALPFSTSLGAHWEPWMIYREFFCNALDEGGVVAAGYPKGQDVVFCVNCPPVEDVFAYHSDYFLNTTPSSVLPGVEIHPGASPNVFYRGVKVYTAEQPFLHTYNITEGISLTEDRTAPYYSIQSALIKAIMTAGEEHDHTIKTFLEAPTFSLESSLRYDYSYNTPSSTFKRVAKACYRAKAASSHAKAWARSHMQEELGYETIPMTPEQRSTLSNALATINTLLEGEVWLPTCWISEEVQSFDSFSDAIYLHPNAFSSPFTLFSTMLHAWAEEQEERETEALAKLLWNAAGQERDITPAERAAHPEAQEEMLFY